MASKAYSITFGLGVMALFCWVVMFLAGTDVWHDVGRPNFWNLTDPPYPDLRALTYSFYLLFVVLVAQLAVTAFAAYRARVRRGA